MSKAPRTHRAWVSETKRLLKKGRVTGAIADYRRLAAGVERAIPYGITDWHLAQTWHLLSLEQARAGDHRAAAATLRRLVDHHRVLLMEHRRAYVAAAAAASMQLWETGDVKAARRMFRSADQLGRGLKPQEYLLGKARAIVSAASKRTSRSPAPTREEPAGRRRRRRGGG